MSFKIFLLTYYRLESFLRTAFVVFHRFWKVVLLLSIVLRYILLPLIYSFIHFFSNILSFSNIVRLTLFNLYVFEFFPVFFL